MSEFKCPHPDCDESNKTFETEKRMKIHHSLAHNESLAKDETDCENCGDSFSYYPSQKEGILCKSCLSDNSVELSDFRDKKSFDSLKSERRECPNCGTVNTVPPAEAEDNDTTFCDGDCYSEYRKENSLVETKCDNCSDDMTIKKYRYKQSENNYCSDECQWNSMRKKTTIECVNCGREKEKYPSQAERVNKRFCSDECRVEYRSNYKSEYNGDNESVDVKCKRCGTEFDKLYCEVKRTETHFCTRDCRHEYYASEDFDHNSYGRGFSKMKREVRERDDYECQICGRDEEDIGRCPSVHHITPVEWFVASNEYRKRDAHYPENGVLLCPKHHGKVDWGVIDLEESISDELAEKLELEDPV